MKAPTPETETRPQEPFFRVLVVVVIAMAGFGALDYGLARADQADRQSTGERLYQQGQSLAAQGRNQEALDHFRSALTKEPANRGYQLALVLAFQRLGKLDEAEAGLADLLQKDPANGLANVTEARILLARGRTADAEWYFHRSIYGIWPDNTLQHRVRVRFELADLLASKGAKSELLAEALPLQDEAPQDQATKKRVAKLLLAAGSDGRAEAIYRDLTKKYPRDGEAYEGLGDAEFAAGQYTPAQAAYLTAIRLGNGNARKQFDFATELLSMDPGARRLSGAERYRRSRTLLEKTLKAWDACKSADQSADSAEEARQTLAAKKPSQDTDAIEKNIALAEALWKARGETCPKDEALRLLMAKLGQ